MRLIGVEDDGCQVLCLECWFDDFVNVKTKDEFLNVVGVEPIIQDDGLDGDGEVIECDFCGKSLWEKSNMWVVKIVKEPVRNDFQEGYFPRRFYYKRDAVKLIAEVDRAGGEAVVEKE